MKKYYFVYKTTNLINGKFYIGVHATKNVNDGYLGSGKRLHDAIKCHGVENFNREILKFFDSYADALYYEQLLVTPELVESDNCYNLCEGGGKPPTMSGSKHPFYQKSRPDSRKRMIENNPSKGKFGKDSATYNKVSVVTKDGDTLQVLKDDPRYLSGEFTHVNKGKLTVRDLNGNVFQVLKDDPRYLSGEVVHNTKGLSLTCPHCNKTGGNTMKRWHFNNCKFRKEGQ
jgi:hypothetical protein